MDTVLVSGSKGGVGNTTIATHPAAHAALAGRSIGLVANTLRPWTQASQQAVALLRSWPYPLVAPLRDRQAYVLLAALGKSLFDYDSANVRDHRADWQPLLRWLGDTGVRASGARHRDTRPSTAP